MEFLASGFADAFISVLAIIGIILVGGFLIFFLGDLVLSVLDPQYMHFWQRKRNGEKDEEKESVKELENNKEETKELEFKFDDADEDAFVKEEPAEIEEEANQPETPATEEAEEVDLEKEEENFRQNMLKAIEERRQKQEEEKDVDLDKFFFDDEDINVFADEQNDEGAYGQEEITEAPVEETVEEVEAPVEETVEEVEAPVEETVNKSLVDKIKAKFEEEIAKLQARNEELEKELGEKETTVPAGSVEEYEARLETLKERLVANEKELRKVKKEYIPLRKVNRTLESDERKLRRKEAIVAKQKVVLYGVNNIADIDEEKAKKLSEELDLLEGLKLSVQHCQEVMNENKDRYPILENTYNILSKNNETIKADIKETEDAIETLKAETETDAE